MSALIGLVACMIVGQDAAPGGAAVGPEAGAHATADDLLRELQSRRPTNEGIPPDGAEGGGPAAAPARLWPEGWVVVDQSGQLRRQGDDWVFAADSAEFDGPVALLPNATLEVMVRTAVHAAGPVRFVVSGRMTVYRGTNHLMVRGVRRAAPEPGESLERPEATSKKPPDAPAVGGDAAAEDVLSVLKAQQPKDAILPVEPQARAESTPKVSGQVTAAVPEGTLLTRRAGRVVEQGGWWTFVFESGAADGAPASLKLLPNLNTQMMVEATQQEEVGTVFVVSGEVTLFQGENYLLPHSATRRVDVVNLRP